MPKKPLVSVMMPCYNASKTLPLALASLIAQTYANWECILVDDGSTDNPHEVVAQINDSRIRYIRLAKNMGRGFARQTALDNARGEYLCMLDADDWIYPDKLQKQVEVMESNSKIVLVSTGMAIVNRQNELVGVRCRGEQKDAPRIIGPLNQLTNPPIAHAPSMIRMPIAKQTNYDLNFKIAEDAEFLLRVLLGNYYAVLHDVAYVYAEHASMSLEKMLLSYESNRRMLRKHKNRFPISSRVNTAKIFAKSLIYRVFYVVGAGDYLTSNRSQPPAEEDLNDFHAAQKVVLSATEPFLKF